MDKETSGKPGFAFLTEGAIVAEQEYWIPKDDLKRLRSAQWYKIPTDLHHREGKDLVRIIKYSAYETTENDYINCVGKFDACRAMLAVMVEKKGISVNPPDDYKGAWHEYLIEQLP